MEDLKVMESLESSNGLNQDFPDDLLLHERPCLLVLADLLEHISIVRILHHNTEQ
jgi:hypothetical protein